MTPEEFLEQNQDQLARDIQAVFTHPRADTFLLWLMDTCCANDTTIDENPIIMAAAEGRRQVWVALNKILSLTQRDINALRGRMSGE